MEEILRDIVRQLAVKGFRTAGGKHWNEAMQVMQNLVENFVGKPAIYSWTDEKGNEYRNFSITFNGRSSKKIVVGAHYDTFEETPGADDNASAVAVLLGLGSLLKNEKILPNSVELVFYACEEPPFFGTEGMGSFHHAKQCNKSDTELMICLEMVGFFSDEKGSQKYPILPLKWIFGSRANYLMLVSNLESSKQLKKVYRTISNNGLIYKRFISPIKSYGMDWSDHRNYWTRGIPAIMITDTSVFRNANYHQLTDTMETLNYEKMALLTKDLLQVLK